MHLFILNLLWELNYISYYSDSHAPIGCLKYLLSLAGVYDTDDISYWKGICKTLRTISLIKSVLIAYFEYPAIIIYLLLKLTVF